MAPGSLFPGLYLYIAAGIFFAVCLLQLVLVLYRNNIGLSKAQISYDSRAISVRVHLRRPIKVDTGQYINIWMPSASFWSFTQTHPFTVVSWSDTPQDHLDLFIQPRRGFTKELFSLSKYGPTTSIIGFNRPHRKTLPINQYKNILMIATSYGITAHLPWLKKLIFDHYSRKTSVHRTHLVWQIKDLGRSHFSTLSNQYL